MRDHFYGYPRPDGSVGIRNYVLMLSGTLYANPTCERVAHLVENTIPVVEGVAQDIVLDEAETLWLKACWLAAATSSDRGQLATGRRK